MNRPPRQLRSDRTRRSAVFLLLAFLVTSLAPGLDELLEDHAWCDLHVQVEHGAGHAAPAGVDHRLASRDVSDRASNPELKPDNSPGAPSNEGDEACGMTWFGPSQGSKLVPPAASGLLAVERVVACRAEIQAHIAQALWRLAPKTSPPA